MDNVRWRQRFDNYTKALQNLDEFLTIEEMNKVEKQGLLRDQGYNDVVGPKAVISQNLLRSLGIAIYEKMS